MPIKQAPSVTYRFGEQLTAFVTRATAEGWGKKYSIDVATLDVDRKAQEKEKQKHLEQKQAFQQNNKKFKADQGARYRRYMAALDVIRAVFKNQPEVMASLSDFKRPKRGGRQKAAPALAAPGMPMKPAAP